MCTENSVDKWWSNGGGEAWTWQACSASFSAPPFLFVVPAVIMQCTDCSENLPNRGIWQFFDWWGNWNAYHRMILQCAWTTWTWWLVRGWGQRASLLELQNSEYIWLFSVPASCLTASSAFEDCMPLAWAGPLLCLVMYPQPLKVVKICKRNAGLCFMQVAVDKPPSAPAGRGTLPEPAVISWIWPLVPAYAYSILLVAVSWTIQV